MTMRGARGRAKAAIVGFALAIAPGGAARASETLVAVAANFVETAESLATLYADRSGHHVTLASGSTGALFAQVNAGAPYAVLLAADSETPEKLERAGRAVAGTRFVYAVGRLTLWSADAGLIGANGVEALRDPSVRHVAIANPDLAPYGEAARQALTRLGLWPALEGRIVLGENVGQVQSLVASGAAELGFVSASALASPRLATTGSRWDVPADLHEPIEQQAVLLEAGRHDEAARAFLSFLRDEASRRLIRRFGYGVE